jgi:Trypsin-co-occurring domain 2
VTLIEALSRRFRCSTLPGDTGGRVGNPGVRVALDEMELVEAVQTIRDELLRAAASGSSSDVAFEVGPIQLEFSVELRRDARARGGIRAFVVSAEADAGMSQARTHKVSLTLTPCETATRDPLLIAAEGEGDPAGLAGAGSP